MSLESEIEALSSTLKALTTIKGEIQRATDLILNTLATGNKLLLCGNGGSAAEAAHFATELLGRYSRNRRALPAIALSSDGSLLTCVGNDYGFEHAFARQIEGLANKGDLVVVFTSSGNSPNIISALETAQRLGIASLAFLGRGGGETRGMATVELVIPGESGRSAQECHLFLIHHFCEHVDQRFP